jgi:hypothetical protein
MGASPLCPNGVKKPLSVKQKSSYILVKTILLVYLLQFVGRAVVQHGHLLVEIRVQKVVLVIKSLICMIILGLLILRAVVACYNVLLGFGWTINALHLGGL